MKQLSKEQFAFANPTSVQLLKDEDGTYYLFVTGVTKTARISFAVAEIKITGLVEDVASIPSIEELLNAK